MESNNKGRLMQLIQAEVDRGWSTREIADRAHKLGHKISHSQIHSLWRGQVAKAPDRDMILALAAGLDLSPAEVQQAVFLDWYGYDPTILGDAGDAFLSSLPREIKTFLKMAGAWLNNLDERERDEIIDEFTRRIMAT